MIEKIIKHGLMGVCRKLKTKFVYFFLSFPTKICCFLLSDAHPDGSVKLLQPTFFLGRGKILFGEHVVIGRQGGAKCFKETTLLEARGSAAEIKVGSNVIFNNSAQIIADNGVIEIGRDCLFGEDLRILTSDFHSLKIDERRTGTPQNKDVIIGSNCFIGNGVTFLKGSGLGKNCVVGACSVVTKSFPDNSVVAGNPAKLLRTLES